MNKILLLLLLTAITIVGFIYGPKAVRLYNLANLYDEESIASNFINIDKLFTVSEPIPSSEEPHIFNKKPYKLPETYFFEGEERNFQEDLDHFKTDGLIVLHNGDMLYENYWNGNSASSKHIAFSVSKSFLSALIGIAVGRWFNRQHRRSGNQVHTRL